MNSCRLKASLFGAFCPFFFARRQPCRIKKNKNHSKIACLQVPRSFRGANGRAGKAKAAGNTSVFSRLSTKHGRSCARENRQGFNSLCPIPQSRKNRYSTQGEGYEPFALRYRYGGHGFGSSKHGKRSLLIPAARQARLPAAPTAPGHARGG